MMQVILHIKIVAGKFLAVFVLCPCIDGNLPETISTVLELARYH